MSHIDNLIDNDNMDETERDRLLKKLITSQVRKDYKERWKTALEEGHGVSRQDQKRIPRWSLLAIAASVLAVVGFFYFTNLMGNSTERLASAFVEQDKATFIPQNTKGPSSEANRSSAIMAFQENDFRSAADAYEIWVNNPMSNREDLFYLSLSYLYSDQLEKAESSFRSLLQNETPDRGFTEESRWYLALTQIMRQQNEEAKTTLMTIEKGKWNADKAMRLIQTME